VKTTAPATLYDQDFHAWCLAQTELLKRRLFEELDVEHLIEEVDGLAGRDRRELNTHLTKLLMHLLKFYIQADQTRRFHSWRKSVGDSRFEIGQLLEQSPGIFQGQRDEVIARCYQHARRKARDETGLALKIFPEDCPWSWEQISADEFWP